MQLIFTRHALQRMTQRLVSKEQVAETLEFPDEILPGNDGEEIAIKSYGSRDVRVVFQEIESDTYLILTVIKSRSVNT
jgi:hypothetical protein